jgi:hypothetical protein
MTTVEVCWKIRVDVRSVRKRKRNEGEEEVYTLEQRQPDEEERGAKKKSKRHNSRSWSFRRTSKRNGHKTCSMHGTVSAKR